MIQCFEGDVRIFICINTVEYNCDGKFTVTKVTYDELKNIGVSLDEAYSVANTNRMITVEDMHIGDVIEAERNVFIFRVA